MSLALRTTEASAPPAAAAPAFVPLADLQRFFKNYRAAHRWAARLSPALRREESGRILVARQARLPDRRTLDAALLGPRIPDTLDGLRVPDGALTRWSLKDRQRFLDTHEMKRRFEALRQRLPRLGFDAVAQLFGVEQAAWLAERGLSAAPRTLYRAFARIDPSSALFDGNVDRRGRACAAGPAPAEAAPGELRHVGKRVAEVSPEAWDMFLGLYLHQNKLRLTRCWKYVQGEASANGWAWPAISTVRALVRRIPVHVVVHARQGPRAHQALCVPKIERSHEETPANHHWVGDQRTMDFLVRAADGARFRTYRPKLTAWLDLRARLFVGWTLTEHANTDTILAAFKCGAAAHGLPRELTMDNGEDYRSIGQRRRPQACDRKWQHLDAERISGFCRRLNIAEHYAIKHHPWAKMIESHFNAVKDGFDRLMNSFRGGSPAERPEDAGQVARLPHELPTLEQARLAFAKFLQAHHAEPQSGSGMHGLTPNLVMERYRAERRTCDPDVLDLLCLRMERTPVKVGRDGVRYRRVLYGRFDENVMRLQGREVWLAVDPAHGDRVTLCDERGTPLCVAHQQALAGTTQETIRDAARFGARMKRAAEVYLRGRDYLRRTPVEQILDRAQAHAAAGEDALRAQWQLHRQDAPAAPVAVARPDLAAAARKLKGRALRATGTCGDDAPLELTAADLSGTSGPCGTGVPPVNDGSSDDIVLLLEDLEHA